MFERNETICVFCISVKWWHCDISLILGNNEYNGI